MDMFLKIIKNKYLLAIILIFCLATILRFWKVPELFFFGIDEEYQTLLASSIVKDFHVIWIGLSVADTGYYIGPGLVYLHAVLLWLSKNDPVIFGYFASLVGVITLIVFYLVTRTIFDKKVAFISSLLYGFSSFIVYYDRRFWNSTFVPLTTILLYFSLVKAKKNIRWYIFTVFLIASSFHIHASLFIFIPIIILDLIKRLIKSKRKIKIEWLTVFSSVIIYFVVTSPLLVYDFVHNFDNLKIPIRMLAQIAKNGDKFSLAQHFNTFFTTITQFWTGFSLPIFFNYLLIIFSAVIIIFFFVSKENKQRTILKTIIVFYLLLFFLYPGPMLDYYYLGFFPFFALIIAIFLKNLDWKIIIFITILSAAASTVAISKWPINNGLAVKSELIKKTVKEIGNNSFYLETNQNYLYFGGWRYLFEAYGKRPSSSQADTMFGWIYPKEISTDKPRLKVIISDSDIKFEKVPINKIKSGVYQVSIFNND